MRKKLGVIPRVGIVATIVWLVWAIGWRGSEQIESWRYAGWNNWYMCSHGEAPEAFAGQDCSIYLKRDEAQEKNIWFNAIGFGLEWAFFGWVAFAVVYLTARWILAGRSPVQPTGSAEPERGH